MRSISAYVTVSVSWRAVLTCLDRVPARLLKAPSRVRTGARETQIGHEAWIAFGPPRLGIEEAVSVLATAPPRPQPMPSQRQAHRDVAPDAESRAWLAALRSQGHAYDQAVARLHELLLRAARFEVSRRRTTLRHLRGEDLDDLALQSADDALAAVLAKLEQYRGASRFTTWAYKFALLEAAVKL